MWLSASGTNYSTVGRSEVRRVPSISLITAVAPSRLLSVILRVAQLITVAVAVRGVDCSHPCHPFSRRDHLGKGNPTPSCLMIAPFRAILGSNKPKLDQYFGRKMPRRRQVLVVDRRRQSSARSTCISSPGLSPSLRTSSQVLKIAATSASLKRSYISSMMVLKTDASDCSC